MTMSPQSSRHPLWSAPQEVSDTPSQAFSMRSSSARWAHSSGDMKEVRQAGGTQSKGVVAGSDGSAKGAAADNFARERRLTNVSLAFEPGMSAASECSSRGGRRAQVGLPGGSGGGGGDAGGDGGGSGGVGLAGGRKEQEYFTTVRFPTFGQGSAWNMAPLETIEHECFHMHGAKKGETSRSQAATAV